MVLFSLSQISTDPLCRCQSQLSYNWVPKHNDVMPAMMFLFCTGPHVVKYFIKLWFWDVLRRQWKSVLMIQNMAERQKYIANNVVSQKNETMILNMHSYVWSSLYARSTTTHTQLHRKIMQVSFTNVFSLCISIIIHVNW